MNEEMTRTEERGEGPVFRPLADIVATGDGVEILLEMPGVAPDNAELSVEGRVLTIRGRTHRVAPERFRPGPAEFVEGDYERQFSLSDDLDADGIAASMTDGVLHVTVPRAAAAWPRRIQVSAG
jgi:HSP20 family molecular chaperone IbpA